MEVNMEVTYLSGKFEFEEGIEFTYTDIASIENCYDKLHTHDFYEILIVVEGSFKHYINNSITYPKSGAVIFFRTIDVHRIEQIEGKECHLINLTYSKKIFDDLLIFMGEGFNQHAFLSDHLPPCAMLTSNNKHLLLDKLNNINTIPSTNKYQLNTALKVILLEILYEHLFLIPKIKQYDLPDWLASLCEEMKDKKNFVYGIKAMTNLSGKTHAYLCRCFKKYLHISPTDFINNIRLNYAQNLLLNSDRSIINICYDVGFDSLGHFYKLFNEHFGTSPIKYRKTNWSNLHLWS
jgi:AraC family cel operon transcriptional repressor